MEILLATSTRAANSGKISSSIHSTLSTILCNVSRSRLHQSTHCSTCQFAAAAKCLTGNLRNTADNRVSSRIHVEFTQCLCSCRVCSGSLPPPLPAQEILSFTQKTRWDTQYIAESGKKAETSGPTGEENSRSKIIWNRCCEPSLSRCLTSFTRLVCNDFVVSARSTPRPRANTSTSRWRRSTMPILLHHRACDVAWIGSDFNIFFSISSSSSHSLLLLFSCLSWCVVEPSMHERKSHERELSISTLCFLLART